MPQAQQSTSLLQVYGTLALARDEGHRGVLGVVYGLAVLTSIITQNTTVLYVFSILYVFSLH